MANQSADILNMKVKFTDQPGYALHHRLGFSIHNQTPNVSRTYVREWIVLSHLYSNLQDQRLLAHTYDFSK